MNLGKKFGQKLSKQQIMEQSLEVSTADDGVILAVSDETPRMIEVWRQCGLNVYMLDMIYSATRAWSLGQRLQASGIAASDYNKALQEEG